MRYKIFFWATVVVVLGIAVFVYISQEATAPEPTSQLKESEARSIAERTCVKGGEALQSGYYNASTKTWWFDANLNATRPGCSPACVVSEETKTAEINWRCTGLVEPAEQSQADLLLVFKEKYPKYATTLSLSIEMQTESYVRGSISFEPSQPGGIFLAVKKAGVWFILHDGNGAIPCSLKTEGFPDEFLSDCAES